MGAITDVAVLVLSTGAVLVTVGQSITAWIQSRDPGAIEVKYGEHSIKLNADNPDQAAEIIKKFLSEHPVGREGRAGE